MSQAVFRSKTGPAAQASATDWVIDKPAGAVEDDLVLVSLAWDGAATFINTVPSGWTLVAPIVESAWPHSLAVYYKVLGASEPDDWTWTFDGVEQGNYAAIAYSSVDTADPINVAASLLAPSDPSGPFHYDTDEITTTVPDCVLVAYFAAVSADALTWQVSGATERGDLYSGAQVTSQSIHEFNPVAGTPEQALVAGTYSKTGTATLDQANGIETLLLAITPDSSAPAIPANTVAPVASGENLSASFTVEVTNGTWTGDTTPVLSYQWLRDGVEIPGATSTSYTLTADDVGELISCEITGTNGAGSDSGVSNELGPIEPEPEDPDAFLMGAEGLLTTRGRVMTGGGLVPPA